MLIIEVLGAVLSRVTQTDRTDKMNPPNFDLRQEPYIAEMWAYAKSSAHSTRMLGLKILSIEARLKAARDCSDDWISAWSQMAALSIGDTRDLHTAVLHELEHLARVYRTLRSEF